MRRSGTSSDPAVRRRVLRGLVMLSLLFGVSAVTWLGYLGVHRIPYRSLRLTVPPEVEEEEVKLLIGVDSTARLFDIDPDSVASRVGAHPWARKVSVIRLPTGTLRVRIEPRIPVALVVNPEGRPTAYVDETATRLPLRAGHAALVPLLRGLTSRHFRADTLVNPVLRDLASVLGETDERTLSICSEFVLLPSGGIRLYTVPFGQSGSIPVELGRSGFHDRLAALVAYWEQAVRTRPDVSIAGVDLRFAGQVVVRDGS